MGLLELEGDSTPQVGCVTLADYFLPNRNMTAVLNRAFNMPLCKPVVIVTRSPSTLTYTRITPDPIVRFVNPKLAALYNEVKTVQVELDDVELTIGKTYTESQITGRGISYVINPTLFDTNGKPLDGIEFDRVPGVPLTERLLDWKFIVRRRA